MRELLIVGIDPGTTLGYAILDTRGNVLKVRSSKLLELNSVVREISEVGSILAIGTDKKKIPGMVEKAAAVTGARTIAPNEDLAVSEKDALASGIETATQHEKDALAAAMFAYRELAPLLEKIRKVLEAENKAGYFMKVTETVVMRERNIRDALREAEEKAKPEAITATEKKTIPEEPKTEVKNEMQALLLKRAERENEILRNYNSKLLKTTKQLNRELALERKAGKQNKPAAEKEQNHSQLVAKMQSIINAREKHIEKLQAEIEKLNTIVAVVAAGKGIATKKLKSLGLDELERQKPGLAEGDTILVENAEIFSGKALDYLKQKSITILTRKTPSAKIERLLSETGIAAMAADGLIDMETESIAVANPHRLAEARRKAGANIRGIIESYKEERRNPK